MTRSPPIIFRALGALLGYPASELRQALPEIAGAVRHSALLKPGDSAGILGLIELLASADPLWVEERYLELFDRQRATSLHLFEHVHGDARDRGNAMVELKAIYERAGFLLAANELPDYLPVVLEYLSCRGLAEAKDMLGDCAHILRAIGDGLRARGSPYATVFAALLGIIDEAGLSEKARPPQMAEPEDLDRDWFEQPAFAPDDPAVLRLRGRKTNSALLQDRESVS